MARCSICGTLVGETEAVKQCPQCQQDYHASCWDEIGGCATYGCQSAAVAEKPPPPVLVGSGWGDTKECPNCRTNIGSSMLVCGCGARFPWADPMTPTEYVAWQDREAQLASSRKLLVGLFVASLTGILSPVTGTIAGIYAWKKRETLGGANGTYLAIGYGSAALGVTYALVCVLLAAGF